MLTRSRSGRSFHVLLVACGAAASLCSLALAQQATTPGASAQSTAESAAPKPLNVGDVAPALKIAHWVKGSPVKGFEKGKAYVVEFWATWCGPCIVNIPKLTALQAKHKDGLVVIGVSSADRRGVEDVRPFVEKQGDKMVYTIAVDDGMATANAYMQATGQGGIPVAYVVDKEGKLAWYGHPANGMEQVVEQVLAGTFNAKTYVDPQKKFAELQQKLAAAADEKNWARADEVFAEMKTLRSDAALQIDAARFQFAFGTEKNKAKAHAIAEELMTGSGKDSVQLLSMLASVVAQEQAASVTDIGLAKRAMARAVELTERKDARTLSILGDVLKREGDYAKALEVTEEAMKLAQAAGDQGMQKALEFKITQIKAERDTKKP